MSELTYPEVRQALAERGVLACPECEGKGEFPCRSHCDIMHAVFCTYCEGKGYDRVSTERLMLEAAEKLTLYKVEYILEDDGKWKVTVAGFRSDDEDGRFWWYDHTGDIQESACRAVLSALMAREK